MTIMTPRKLEMYVIVLVPLLHVIQDLSAQVPFV